MASTRLLIKLSDRLQAALPLAGSRQLAGGPSAAELSLMLSWRRALAPILAGLYHYPIRNGVETAPAGELAALEAWALAELDGAPGTADLSSTMTGYMERGYNIGGRLALTELSLAGTFTLTNAGILAALAALAYSMADISGEMSLTRTTGRELAAVIWRLRQAGLDEAALAGRVNAYISARSTVRAGITANTETVRATRSALVETYGRNGITAVIYRNAPEMTASGPCPICTPYDGQSYNLAGNVVAGPTPPLHPECVCYHEPDTSDWQAPAEVWTGE